MRILIVNSFYYPEIKGGAEYSVKKMSESLAESGNEVLVLTSGFEDEEVHIDGVRIIRRRFRSLYHSYKYREKNIVKRILHRFLDFNNILNASIIKEIIENFKPEIVHTNNIYEITPQIWVIAKKSGIPVVHTLRDYYLLCPKTNLINSKMELCNDAKLICKLYRIINRTYSKYVDVITTPSNMMMDNINQYNIFPYAKQKVISNAIEFDWEIVKKRINKKKTAFTTDSFVFVYLGGLHKHKGIEFMIDAFRLINNERVKLYIAGKGALQEYVESICEQDKRIIYKGFLEEKEVHRLLDVSNVLICPSLWAEPFGRVVLDAYSFGVPVIATKIGALTETVDDGKTGILVEPGNVEDLYNALTTISKDRDLFNLYVSNIPEKLSQYSLTKQTSEFCDLYKMIYRRNNSGKKKNKNQ